jgi:uncharacterized protein involved in outer membrane biogenesis
MKKTILILVLVLAVALVAGVVVVGLHLGDIVKAGLERVGPKITQTSLKVDAVNVSLLGGSAGVKGLVLGNPEGYPAPSAISIGKAAVSLSPGSILSDKIVIHSVEVRDTEITFEGNPLGANNLTKIMDNVNALTPAADKAATNAPAARTSTSEKKPAKKLEVDDFLIAGAKVHANLTGLVSKEINLILPDIHFTDLGKGSDGITAADLAQKILGEIRTDTVKALTAAVNDLGKQAADVAKAAAQNAVNGALTNANKAVGENVDKLKTGLGGLLGK